MATARGGETIIGQVKKKYGFVLVLMLNELVHNDKGEQAKTDKAVCTICLNEIVPPHLKEHPLFADAEVRPMSKTVQANHRRFSS